MSQPNVTYKPLVLTAHKNPVVTLLTSPLIVKTFQLVSTGGMPVSSFLLSTTLTTTNNRQEATTSQQCSMADAATNVVEEQ
jgi:acid phosphatase family membrane protein YuiD